MPITISHEASRRNPATYQYNLHQTSDIINTIYTKHSAGKSAQYQRTYLKQSDINTTSCATSLVHTHSIQQRLVPTFIAKPDTYFEISRPSYFTTDTGSTIRHFGPTSSARIVLHHSPSVNESIYNVG
eukprot:scaffold2273_cov209-Alexandrium_tamarense.AAC.1